MSEKGFFQCGLVYTNRTPDAPDNGPFTEFVVVLVTRHPITRAPVAFGFWRWDNATDWWPGDMNESQYPRFIRKH